MAHPRSDIAVRLDRLPLTRLHVGAVAVCTFALACALGEISLSAALSAIVSTGPNKASSGELSALLSSVYVGAIVGAPLFGYLADRVGRRTVMIMALLWMALTSTAAGFTHDVGQLTLCRGLAGLALGALPPLTFAFLADLLPPQRRGAMALWCVALSMLGSTCTLLFLHEMTSLPLGVDAWRLTFWGLAVACVVAVAGFVLLPESPRFLSSTGRDSLAIQTLVRFERSTVLRGLKGVTASPDAEPHRPAAVTARPRAWLVFVLFALSPWATSAFPILWGAVLTQRGFSLNDALLVIGLSTLGPLVGNIAGSTAVDRIDRRHVLAGCSLVMVLTGAVFVTSEVAAQVLCTAVLYGMASSIYLSVMNLYAAEFFPTEERGRRLAGAWALNRVGAALAPLVVVPLLRSQGAATMFGVIAAALLAGVLVIYLSPKGRQRQGLS